MGEKELIDQVIRGKTDRFEELVRKYNTTLYRIGMSYLRDEMDVEDMMQNTYIQAYQKLSAFRSDASFSTWLIRIMINNCLMFKRKRSSQEKEKPILSEPVENPLEILARNELQGLLERSVMELPDHLRQVYVMREIEGLSTENVAGLTGTTQENVKVRLHRAKKSLKALLLEQINQMDLFMYYRPKCDVLTSRVMEKVKAISNSL